MPDKVSPITVIVAGAAGKMGREALATLQLNPRFQVVAVVTRSSGQAQGISHYENYQNAADALMAHHPDVWLDFTDATSVVKHVDACVSFGVRPVIGATGYSMEDIQRWDHALTEQGLGGIAAPNFAIGALLMMRFAAEAAKFFEHAEIIEYHHDGKKDAPSGTAKRTAETMSREREAAAESDEIAAPLQRELQPSRGLQYQDIPIHSIRLPGLVAHQEVMFGGTGEVLTIRHDSLSRTSFMPGVQLACERVMNTKGLVYGLEQLLW